MRIVDEVSNRPPSNNNRNLRKVLHLSGILLALTLYRVERGAAAEKAQRDILLFLTSLLRVIQAIPLRISARSLFLRFESLITTCLLFLEKVLL